MCYSVDETILFAASSYRVGAAQVMVGGAATHLGPLMERVWIRCSDGKLRAGICARAVG